jgi:hypothetical protein
MRHGTVLGVSKAILAKLTKEKYTVQQRPRRYR